MYECSTSTVCANNDIALVHASQRARDTKIIEFYSYAGKIEMDTTYYIWKIDACLLFLFYIGPLPMGCGCQ